MNEIKLVDLFHTMDMYESVMLFEKNDTGCKEIYEGTVGNCPRVLYSNKSVKKLSHNGQRLMIMI